MNDVKRDLPRGMGYKSCFMVVEGSTQKNVSEAFLQGRKMKYTYDAGLAKLQKAGSKEKRLMVTGTYKKQNYVIGDDVGFFFYDTEEFLKKCEPFSRVYVYMTDRVSETHGFALVENGQLVRLFCYDENEIQNIGEPLPEEIELGYRLPANFKEARDAEFTTVDEDVIVALAFRQVGIDVEQYPYKDVKLGKRFEYSSELAADPYPDPDEDWCIPEAVWELPVVQRFMDCTSVDEQLQVLKEVRGTITHRILDAFCVISGIFAGGYERLSARADMFECMLSGEKKYSHGSPTDVSQEEFLEKIRQGTRVFEGCTFKHFTLENRKWDALTFVKCEFLDVKLIDNEINRLECKDCRFVKLEVSGNLKGADVILEETEFDNCAIHDLEMNGGQKAKWRSSSFNNSTFENIKLCMKLSIVHGSLHECKGRQLELLIDQCVESYLIGCKFEGVRMGADLTKTRLMDTEIQDLEKVDADREVVWKENHFRNSKVNDETFPNTHWTVKK